ncbi:hypothetical protein IJT93_05515 [bacterium]|nr:hypothetical protein [bacterium]
MFRASGIDLGKNGNRAVSVGAFWGAVKKETEPPSGMPSTAAVPSDKLTFRTLNVPNTSRDIQESVIREELMLSLPFSIEETSWDWVVNDDVATVFIVLNQDLRSFRERLGKDALIDAEPLSYLRLMKAAKTEEALIFDFGASRTSVCAVKSGCLDWVKVSFKGGDYLNKEIAKRYDITPEEAEQHKIALGTEEPVCRQWLNDLAAYNLLVKPVPFDKVFICGGGAQMKGLELELGTLLGQTVQPIPLPDGLSPYCDASAYGAALASKSKYPHISLEEVEPEKSDLPWKYAVWLLVILALASVNLELRKANAESVVQKQVAAYQEAAKPILPKLAEMQPETYQKELDALTEKNLRNTLLLPDSLLQNMARLAKPLKDAPSMEIRRLELKGEQENPSLIISGQTGTLQQVEEFRKSTEDIIKGPEIIDSRKNRAGVITFSIEGRL